MRVHVPRPYVSSVPPHSRVVLHGRQRLIADDATAIQRRAPLGDVARRRDDAAGGPGHARGRDRRPISRRVRPLVPRAGAGYEVALRGRGWRRAVGLEIGLPEMQWFDEAPLEHLAQGQPGGGLDDHAEQDEAGVAVVETGSRIAVGSPDEIVEDLLRRPVVRLVRLEDALVVGRIFEVVVDAAGVAEQLAQRDLVGRRKIGQPVREWIVDRQRALVGELHDRRRHEGLRDRADHERHLGRGNAVRRDLRKTAAGLPDAAVGKDHGRRSARDVEPGALLIEDLLELRRVRYRQWRGRPTRGA